MKTKILGTVLIVAVCLGLLLVPATPTSLPSTVSANPGELTAGIEIHASEAKVGFDEEFTVTVTINNTANEAINTVGAFINFSPDLISVTADFTLNPVWTMPTANLSDNVKGTIDLAGGILAAGGTTASIIPVATINMKSNSSKSGIADINLVNVTGRESMVLNTPQADDILNWSYVVNATVKVGKAKLTVNVTPQVSGIPMGQVTINNTITPSVYPNSTNWSWDQVVTLDAVNPAPGWEFDYWSDDASGIDTHTSIVMGDDRNVTANFVEKEPGLSVVPKVINLTARYGPNSDNDTVEITNTGGKLLNWTAAWVPTWAVGDVWSYMNTYDTVPNPSPPPTFVSYPNTYWNPLCPCPVNNTILTMTVTGEDADNYYAFADWPLADPQRTDGETKASLCMGNASVTVNKTTLEYVQQIANLTLYMGAPPGLPVVANVTWAYDTTNHGYPHWPGKNWTYNMTVVMPPPVGTKVVPAQAMVTNWGMSMGGYTDVCEITHASPDIVTGTVFMQQYWSDTARNFVFQWDGGTFNYPPVDVRALLTPSWLLSPTSGSLATGQSNTLTVTANVTGLDVGTYTRNFTISAPGSVLEETVKVNLEVLAATTIDVCRNIITSTNSGKPGETSELYPGETFEVFVNFTSPILGFNAIGLTDIAPDGWTVELDTLWCDPEAMVVDFVSDNKAEILWSGPPDVGYAKDQPFSARYNVTVPTTADPGLNSFGDCCMTKGKVEYYFSETGPFESFIMGESMECDSDVVVTVPGDIVGETRDVNADELADVEVTLYRVTDGIALTPFGDGVAAWSTDQSKSGDYSVKLDVGTVGLGNAGKVMVEVDPIAIADFTGVSYWVWEPAGIVHGGQFTTSDFPYGDPYINIFLDRDNDGVADDYLEGIESYTKSYVDEHGSAPLDVIHTGPTPNTWVEMAEGYGFYDSNDSWGSGMTIYNAGSLAEWQTWFAGNTTGVTVVAVGVYFGFWADDPAGGVYVDDITISGTTYDLEKSGVESGEVALRGDSDISSPDYIDTAYVTGCYSVVANKTRYHDIDTSDGLTLLGCSFTVDLTNQTLLSAGREFDFEGNYGLVPRACDMSYAMKSVNLWLFAVPGHDEWRLDDWKVTDVINSWLFPS